MLCGFNHFRRNFRAISKIWLWLQPHLIVSTKESKQRYTTVHQRRTHSSPSSFNEMFLLLDLSSVWVRTLRKRGAFLAGLYTQWHPLTWSCPWAAQIARTGSWCYWSWRWQTRRWRHCLRIWRRRCRSFGTDLYVRYTKDGKQESVSSVIGGWQTETHMVRLTATQPTSSKSALS